jgi:3-oxoacyl-(acyl-carrier-protein) synthase
VLADERCVRGREAVRQRGHRQPDRRRRRNPRAPAEVDAIIPYGSGVPSLDSLEANALARVFGNELAKKPVITLAPSIGATVAGFGAIAVAVAARAIAEQRLPARLNSKSTGSVAAAAAPSAPCALRHILVCTPSLGGQNSAAVISKPA